MRSQLFQRCYLSRANHLHLTRAQFFFSTQPAQPAQQVLWRTCHPQAWLNANLAAIRQVGSGIRKKLKIRDGTIGPLAPVLENDGQFLYFCAGRPCDEIQRLGHRPVERLEEWANFHYQNGRVNCLVGRENFQSNDEQVVGQKMDEWHANFPVRAAHKWNWCFGKVFITICIYWWSRRTLVRA